MHNAAFAKLKLNWRYVAFEVELKRLEAAIEGAKAMQFAGLNLTVPHKLLALEMVDELDESATTWGAVNTIKFVKGSDGKVRAVGYNTDADAIVAAVRSDLKIKFNGTKVLLLGAGGAGQTTALRLAAEGAELFLVNRTQSKADNIAEKIRRRHPLARVTVGYPQSPVDLMINATSLGLKAGDPLPLDEKQFPLKQARTVYDMVYRPAQTKLLKAAKKAGCKTANGIGMLLHQGAKAFEIWTGKRAPLDVMRRALEQNIYSK